RAAGRSGGRPVRCVRRGGPTACPGAHRRLLRRRRRSHGRARRADRQRQVDAGLAAGPAGRPGHRRGPARPRRPARAGPRRGGRPGRAGQPGDVPVRRHGARQRDARRGHRRRAGPRGALAGPGRAVRRRAAAGTGHPDRRARHDAVRRPAAAARAGPGAGPAPATAHPRRRHLQRRPGGGGGDPARAALRRPRRDRRRGRLPPGHDRARRRGGLDRARQGRRPWHARGADRPHTGLRAAGQRVRRRGRAAGRAGRCRGGGPMTRMSANRPLETDDALTLAGAGRRDGALATMKRGLRLVPELRQGLGLTLLLALIATGGRVVVPLAVQQTLDRGLLATGGPDLSQVAWIVAGCAGFVLVAVALPKLQRRLAGVYATVRKRIGDLLGAVSESVVGAQTVRAYAVEDRTAERIDAAIDRHYRSAVRAQKTTVLVFTSGELVAALANAAVVVAGVLLGIGGHGLTAGKLVAFLFLVTLFIAPVQVASEALSEAQNALASFRRVLDVVDAEPDVADPAGGSPLPPGPLAVRFDSVMFRYPQANRAALVDVDLEIRPRSRVAVVGETGSGKTTFAKLLTRLMDPTSGQVLVGGVPLTEVPFGSLRTRVVMVPQDGFLFDESVADNVRYGRPDATDDEIVAAFGAL